MIDAYIIYLSKFPNSVSSANKLVTQLKEVDINPILFEGSYGDEVEKEFEQNNRHVHSWGIKGPIPNHKKMRYKSPGIIGCFLSHYRLWQKCVELNKPIMIFEDDASIIRPYYDVEFEDVLSLVFSHSKKMAKYIHYLEASEGTPEAKFYKQTSMPGNAGYFIKPHAAKVLVDEYKNSFLPADNAINQKLVKIEIHSHMMGKAVPREKYLGKTSIIKSHLFKV